MKNTIWIYQLLLIIVSLTLVSGCAKEKAKEVPIVRTSEVSKITEYSATCGGIVTLEGDAPVFERGICWDTTQVINEISSPHSKTEGGFGEFISTMSSLHDSTKYYVRAYAINNYGTGYGEAKMFTTLHTKIVDQRDKFVGYWQFLESGSYKSTDAQSYIVIISKNSDNSNQVLLKNFGNPGTHDLNVIGIVASNQIVVSQQTMSNGWVVEALGNITSSVTMSWAYSIKIGGNNFSYTAIATKQ